MEFPKESKTCGCRRNISTQKCECQLCSGLNQEICGLCGKRVPSISLSNEIVVENSVPDNTCQCFLSSYSEIDIPEKEDFKSDEKTELSIIQITDSQKFDQLDPVKEDKSDMEKDSSGTSEKDDIEDNEQSKTPEFSNSSNGYALSLDEQSDRNSLDHRNITSPSSGEESKSSSNADKVENNAKNLDISKSKANLEHKNGSSDEYKRSDSSTSEEGLVHNKTTQRKSSNSEDTVRNANNRNWHYNKVTSRIPGKFGLGNQNIRFTYPRPPLPRPFPQHYRQSYQPYINPAMNMPVLTPPRQMYRPYINPLINAPVIQTNFSGRFSVASRPQLGTSYHQQSNTERCATSFTKKLQAHAQQPESEANRIQKLERVASWLDEIECNPPDEEPTLSSQSENEQSFSGLSTDERSSAEISEEENRRQRSLRRPPRNIKRNKPK